MTKNDELLAMSLITAASGFWSHGQYYPYPRFLDSYEKPKTQCLLPGCEVLHSHNGGYCCADHCRQHQALLKEKIE